MAKVLPRFKRRLARVELIPSKGGCFEITVGTKLLYSKLKTGQFPNEEEILQAIEQALT